MRHAFTALAACAAFAAAAPAQAADYVIDAAHTTVFFEINHFGASINRARFDKKEGTVQFDPAAKTGKVNIKIDAASISSGVPPFDKHLKSADLFDVEKYPSITFAADQFTFDGDKVKEVKGQLTLKGKTHPVTLAARQFTCYPNQMVKREVCGGDFETTIDRTLFDLGYGPEQMAGKQVHVVISVEAVRQ